MRHWRGMKLYTLISLALAIFGGAYSALAALRAYWDSWVKECKENAERFHRKISEHYGVDTNPVIPVTKSRERVLFARTIWLWANALPIFIFTVFVFSIAFWVLKNWSVITTQKDGDVIDYNQFPWNCCWIMLFLLVTVSALCVIVAIISLICCHFLSKSLREKNEMVIAEESKSIVPDSSPKTGRPT